MKGILVTTKNKVSVIELEEPLFISASKKVFNGGLLENVNPMGFKEPYCFIVHESGRIVGLPTNYLGSLAYGTSRHGEPIVGPIVILKNGMCNGQPDIVGLDDAEIEEAMSMLKKDKRLTFMDEKFYLPMMDVEWSGGDA